MTDRHGTFEPFGKIVQRMFGQRVSGSARHEMNDYSGTFVSFKCLLDEFQIRELADKRLFEMFETQE